MEVEWLVQTGADVTTASKALSTDEQMMLKQRYTQLRGSPPRGPYSCNPDWLRAKIADMTSFSSARPVQSYRAQTAAAETSTRADEKAAQPMATVMVASAGQKREAQSASKDAVQYLAAMSSRPAAVPPWGGPAPSPAAIPVGPLPWCVDPHGAVDLELQAVVEASSRISLLERLVSLRDRQVLTASEFEAEKAKLLTASSQLCTGRAGHHQAAVTSARLAFMDAPAVAAWLRGLELEAVAQVSSWLTKRPSQLTDRNAPLS
eukprot:COSAG01_NODE_4756_length_4763_cov_4.080617_1_plen_262_part_00